jgi:hypothetical protein
MTLNGESDSAVRPVLQIAMPRRARLDAPGTLHHMMIRGIEGESNFFGNQDPEYGVSLAEIAGRAGVCTSAIVKAIQKKERQMSQV